jgi:hypothetical protein
VAVGIEEADVAAVEPAVAELTGIGIRAVPVPRISVTLRTQI